MTNSNSAEDKSDAEQAGSQQSPDPASGKDRVFEIREIGGFKGAEPTRFGDWEKNGRCIDF